MFWLSAAGMFRVMADSEVGRALRSVLERIAIASKARPPELQWCQPRLVAVTKTKPMSLVKEAYLAGQRHFGENYVKELEEKGRDPEVLEQYNEIRWHFIGHLQRNKVNKVITVPNLFMVETLDSIKLATAVNDAWGRLQKPDRLKVMIQVNTSGEENKHGCLPSEAADFTSHVINNCPNLELQGLMTIGAFDHDLSNGPNPDFQTLIKCKQDVCSKLGLAHESMELSMGMSNDFEHAISVGSSNVRVGSTIFGAREYKPKASGTEAGSSQKSTPESAAGQSPTPEVISDIQGTVNKVQEMSVKDDK